MEVYNLFYGAVYLFTGLWTGSFLNVCVWRFPRQLSPIKGRSSCPRCGHALSPGDLVPVFSWLFLRGKCRYCHRPISRRYPLTEALTGLVFLLCFYVFGAGFRSVPACLFASALITAAWIDWDFTYIPDGISLFILLAGLLSLIPLPAYGLLTRFSWKAWAIILLRRSSSDLRCSSSPGSPAAESEAATSSFWPHPASISASRGGFLPCLGAMSWPPPGSFRH